MHSSRSVSQAPWLRRRFTLFALLVLLLSALSSPASPLAIHPVAAAPTPGQPDLLIPTSGATPGGVWHYNAATGWTLHSAGLPTGWYWRGVAASPTDPDRWLLWGDTGGIRSSDGHLVAQGTTTPILWQTTDAGLTWSSITLNTPPLAAGISEDQASGQQFSAQFLSDGVTVAVLGNVNGLGNFFGIPTNGLCFWKGTGTTLDGAEVYGDYRVGLPAGNITAGPDGDAIISGAFAGRVGTPSNWEVRYYPGGSTTNINPGPDYGELLIHDIIPGSPRAMVGVAVDATFARMDYHLYTTPDYRTTAFSDHPELGGVGSSIGATQDAIYIGGRGDGILKVTDALGTPTTSVVYGNGVGIAYLRVDRQTHTAVAAWRMDRTGIAVLASASSAWQTLSLPPGVPPAELTDRLEIIGVQGSGPAPLTVEITDAQGKPVAALATNDEGWPSLNAATSKAANPITVTVTVNNMSSTDQAYNLRVPFNSPNNATRFYVFAIPSTPLTGPVQCFAPTIVPYNNSEFSHTSYSTECQLMLRPGESQVLHWSVWVQPSKMGTLTTSAELLQNDWVTVVDHKEATVDVPQANIHPVVFIHGILGSMPPQNKLLIREQDMWEALDPFLGSYWPLMDQLQKIGYEWNTTLFAQAYDWRENNDRSADVLATSLVTVTQNAQSLDYVAQDNSKIKADLIVHSMGGLVSRAYIQRPPGVGDGTYHGDVRKIIFIASPHKGFAYDYQTWEGSTWARYMETAPFISGNFVAGYALTTLLDGRWWPVLIYKHFKPTYDDLNRDCQALGPGDHFSVAPLGAVKVEPPGLFSQRYLCDRDALNSWVHVPGRGIDSLRQMLPTTDVTRVDGSVPAYLVDEDGNSGTGKALWPWSSDVNTYLHDLNANIGNLSAALKLQNIYVIYGDEYDTDVKYEVTEPEATMWRHGYVSSSGEVPELRGDALIIRDSTTLRASGLLPGLPSANEQKLVQNEQVQQGNARHVEIMYHSEVQREWVPRFLGAIGSTVSLPFESPYKSPDAITNLLKTTVEVPPMLAVSTLCPVNVLITDPQGRRLGYDPATGAMLHEIPNAFVTSPGIDPQFLLITDPLTGTYQISTAAYGAGAYGLFVDHIDANGMRPIDDFSGQVITGEVKLHTLSYTPASPHLRPPAAQHAVEGTTAGVALGAFDAPAAGSPWSVEVDWGDGSGHTTFTTAVTGTLGSQPHTYADDGSYTVSVTVTSADGHSGRATFPVMVDNAAPSVGAITAMPNPARVNTTITVSASFADPGIRDTHTAVWDWGDGSSSTATLTEANGAGTVSSSHTYTSAGVYTVRLTLTDPAGAVGQASLQSVVVYDPGAGFVTGGGWITSPQGAYTPDPALTGKASFGFNARYAKGATTPSGQTRFSLHVASMEFQSSSYQWLVVAGAKAQYKGVGTINGRGAYGFLLTAIDGALPGGGGSDSVRIKIWEQASGQVVYDTQPGAADDATPVTSLGGGSIVIHK